MEKVIALVGNPNTGKTTFFNTVSKSNEHVGNWHGVTVDIKEKEITVNNEKTLICDLPGIYSLTNYSYEEEIAKRYLYQTDCVVLNICDANNLGRNLFLSLQLIEMGKKVVICINMKKEFLKNGRELKVDELSKLLNVPIFFIDANNKKEVNNVINFCQSFNLCQSNYLPYVNNMPLLKVKQILKTKKIDTFKNINDNFIYTKILEQDEYVLNSLNLSIEDLKNMEKLWSEYSYEEVSLQRYSFIEKVVGKTIINKTDKVYGYSKLDKILLNKFLCFPCFFAILLLIFYLTFSSVGNFLTEKLSFLIEIFFSKPIINFVNNTTTNQFIISFVEDAIVGGVCSIIGFLPQIVLLFLFLNILEDSGYMSRLAFTLEDFFSKIGLSGKSVFALLMGFACSTTATLTSRTLEDKNCRIKTAILTPYISCSAKLPVYSVICGAFFAQQKTLIIFSLYILGVLVAILVSLIMEKTILKSGVQSFMLEFPPYRIPKFSRVIKNILINAKQFILRVGCIMLGFSIIIWIMQNCNFAFKFVESGTILESLGKIIAPIFVPLGFGNWAVCATLICGIFAKEIIVSSMGIINNINLKSSMTLIESLTLTTSVLHFSKEGAFSFLLFSLLYLPCVSTISVFIKEIGLKWTICACVIEFLIAYFISFFGYKIFSYFNNYGIVAGFVSLLIFGIIVFGIFSVKHFIKSKDKCKNCTGHCKIGCNKKYDTKYQ